MPDAEPQAMAPKRRILVVDDDPHSTMIIRETLELDYDVNCVSSGEACLDEVNAFAPDLILLDMMMPGMSGADVCKRLRNDAQTKGVPVIFVSSLEVHYLQLFAGQANVEGALHKPIDVNELLHKVHAHLN